ncbi:acylglycerol kinase family protein [Sphingomonas sp.]|uniref:diacylglycerol/lipid kinase family protein n=1 Tax=Sphingomonas sp. TaxID=28214 RepID=UPI00286D7AC6|nr:acylglycerol kinase family protein [Sphingomonas sp.]
MGRPRIALLSNPKSTGNIAQLSRIRALCDQHPDIFHYEVERAEQIGDALKTIARVRPKMLVINGGDGTVQAALTEIHNGGHFGDEPPPVAVLPNGKTNLIAMDLGAQGDPIVALERLLGLAQADLAPHIVARELIALRCDPHGHPVIGMFLGGAGLADTMLYCRHKIYPLGLPNGLSHALTAVALLFRMLFRLKADFLPPNPSHLQVSVARGGRLSGRFSLLAVTTLERMLLSSELGGVGHGRMKLVAIEERPGSLLKALFAGLLGKLGKDKVTGVHFEEADEISIEGDRSNLILDGEMFQATLGQPVVLRRARPLSFVRLAAV